MFRIEIASDFTSFRDQKCRNFLRIFGVLYNGAGMRTQVKEIRKVTL